MSVAITQRPQTEIALNTHAMVSDIHRTILQGQEGNNCKNSPVGGSQTLAIARTNSHRFVDSRQVSGLNHRWTHYLIFKSSIPGEFPPLPPRTFFGRDELVEKIVDLTEGLTPIALISAGGIGKTSVALTVLHHDRIKRRFGHDRRFIRCDKFPASCAHFLRRLSEVTGAGIENPKDLTPLYPLLSSRDMVIVLDNAESILDTQGTDKHEIYDVVEELGRFSNLCILITSRISTTPSDYTRLDIPTLSMDAACDTFFRIHGDSNRTDLINTILEQLDFHPLSITLLATVASQNRWDVDRLTREWEQHRTRLLRTEHNKSLAAAIELSLTSPLFRNLGPDARSLLEVVAFFPQGIDENNLEWFFPTIPDSANIFNKFCTLSLTYRNGEFVTMLAPLRDYLCPKDPNASSLLCTVKERYFARMSIDFNPNDPGFAEARWITSEDVNVEHLLDVFTTIDTSSTDVWRACGKFMEHLSWHKTRLTILGPKVEGLPDDHHSKPRCLYVLAQLFERVGNLAVCKRLLTRAVGLYGKRGDDKSVARALRSLSHTNQIMGLYMEGIEQAREAVEISERLGDTVTQIDSLIGLASLFKSDGQLDAAGETISRAINLIGEKGDQFLLCQSHCTLGEIHGSKGEIEKAIPHFKMALEIATSFNWHDRLFWINLSMVQLFHDEGRFQDAQTCIECAVQYAAHDLYYLAIVAQLQAHIWYKQHRFKEARSEALRAANAFEKLGAAVSIRACGQLLQDIQKELDAPAL